MIRYTQEKISKVVTDAATIGVVNAAEKHKVSTQAIYGWRRKAKTSADINNISIERDRREHGREPDWSIASGLLSASVAPSCDVVAEQVTSIVAQENRLLRQLLAAREQEIAVLRECLQWSNGTLVSIVGLNK